MKIAVTGAAGMLGTAIIDRFFHSEEVIATDITRGYAPTGVRWQILDLLDSEGTHSWLKKEKPDVVIHCAAIVNVDNCETRPDVAMDVHAGTTQTIASAISSWNGKLVYISTDSVFDGRKTGLYIESDSVNPLNVYAKTKLAGEKHALNLERGLVLRTNIFGWSRAEKTSFAEWVIKGLVNGDRLTMFADVMYTPIHVSHLSELIARSIVNDLTGLYHAAGSTVLSKHDFALITAKAFGLSSSNIAAISVDGSGLGAARPKNMALDNKLIRKDLSWDVPGVDTGISLLKSQYDNGWVAAIKERTVGNGYKFWEK